MVSVSYQTLIVRGCELDGESEDCGAKSWRQRKLRRQPEHESTLKSGGPEPFYAPFELIVGLLLLVFFFSHDTIPAPLLVLKFSCYGGRQSRGTSGQT